MSNVPALGAVGHAIDDVHISVPVGGDVESLDGECIFVGAARERRPMLIAPLGEGALGDCTLDAFALDGELANGPRGDYEERTVPIGCRRWLH